MNFNQLEQQAFNCLNQQQYSQAIELYETCIMSNPTQMSNYWYLGLAQLLQGDVLEAQATWVLAMSQGTPEQMSEWTSELFHILANQALSFHQAGNLQIAKEVYWQILELQPNNDWALNNLGSIFTSEGNKEKAIEYYQKAIDANPNCVEAYHNLALAHKQAGKLLLATHYLKKALEIKPSYQAADSELRGIYRASIPEWHFPMMNDTARNIAYQRAIEKAVTDQSIFLEIGTGSGLLAMIAARANAKQVVTCEVEELIAAKAQEIIQVNQLDHKVKVINKKSTDLKVGEDLPEKADILVTETFGADLLGEGAIESLEHAFDHLVKPDVIVIPKGAAIYVALIQSEEIYNRRHVEQVCGFDLSPFNEFSDILLTPLQLKMYDYQLISEVCEAFQISFAKNQLTIKPHELELKVTQDGEFNAIACWFDLFLDDEVVLTTSPLVPSEEQGKSWGQRVQVLERSTPVKQGETVRVRVSNDSGRSLFFEVL